MWWVAPLTLVLSQCEADPALTYAPFVRAYDALSTGTVAPELETRRRSVQAPRRWALETLTIVGETTHLQRHVISQAFQYTSLLYTADAPESVVVSTQEPVPPGAVVGWFNGTTVAIFLSRIGGNDDLLFMVTVHEILHQLAFGGVDVGHGSFSDRSVNQVYTGTTVTSCLGSSPRTDPSKAHWANDVAPFDADIMEPVLPSGSKVALARCSAAAVIDTRPTWALMACTLDAQCGTEMVCVGHAPLVGYCAYPTQTREATPVRTRPTLIGLGIFLFIYAITRDASLRE
jgi:hypothetical protein